MTKFLIHKNAPKQNLKVGILKSSTLLNMQQPRNGYYEAMNATKDNGTIGTIQENNNLSQTIERKEKGSSIDPSDDPIYIPSYIPSVNPSRSSSIKQVGAIQ